MKKYLVLTITVLTLLFSFNSYARVKIGIPPFENKAQISNQLSDSFVDMLTTAFVKTRKFDVVERSSMTRIVEEQQLGAYGAVPVGSAAKMGQLIGAKYMVIGVITQAGNKTSGVKAFGMNLGQATSMFGVDVRLVDTTTGKIIRAESFSKEKSAMNMGAMGAQVNLETGDLGELAREVVNELVRLVTYTIYPVKVVKATNKEVYLNYGCGTLTKGDSLQVFIEGEELIDPDTGDSLGGAEELVGTVKVSRCTPKLSVAKITKLEYDGASMEVGMIVRPIKVIRKLSKEYSQESIDN